MTTVALYLLFIAALSGYRSSRYWPQEIKGLRWLASYGYGWGCALLGLVLLWVDKGWTTGLLLALCIYMTVLSCLMLLIHCNRLVRLIVFILFHLICLFGLIVKF